ncbi:uncharacterized protein LOC123206083 [Mangifera indica]|uniref:uncharacterized protein LOC123206083 n=1 Tax=Mangifera indica TaxID=29780 RepID=UPI001CFAA84E|nr:uncharacterized protein LOC123206083 [Mangifera indica]
MSKKDPNNKIARERPGKDAVIITYYVESSTIQSNLNKSKPSPFHKKAQATRNRGYDRRAELLAYANDLRVSGPRKVHWSRGFSRCKTSKWKFSITPAKLRSFFNIRIFQRRRKEYGLITDVKKRKKNNSGTSNASDICRKLKRLLKELPYGCQCYKGNSYK